MAAFSIKRPWYGSPKVLRHAVMAFFFVETPGAANAARILVGHLDGGRSIPKLLIRIDDVSVFPWDADDVAHDRATLEQIVKGNEGKAIPTAAF